MNEYQSCPICGCGDSRETIKKEFRGSVFAYNECSSCSVLFRTGVDEVSQESLYSYQEKWQTLSREDAYPELNAGRYRGLLSDLSRRVKGKRLLDVGCGKGHFVFRAQEAGWDSLGIEVTDAAVSVAQRFESPVIKQDFLEMKGREFDVVSMFELVEHLEEPRKFLAKAQEVLAPGGMLFVTTPNRVSLDARLAGSKWRAYDPEHLVLFSPPQLASLIRDEGFEIVKLATRNLSPSLIKQATIEKFRSKRARSTEQPAAPVRSQDQEIRRRIHSNAATSCLVESVNAVISSTQIGSTIRLWARKR